MIIKNGQVLLFEEGGFVKRDILVKDGKIIKVAEGISPEEAGEEIVDAKGKFITPGLIDATAISVSVRRGWAPLPTTVMITATR